MLKKFVSLIKIVVELCSSENQHISSVFLRRHVGRQREAGVCRVKLARARPRRMLRCGRGSIRGWSRHGPSAPDSTSGTWTPDPNGFAITYILQPCPIYPSLTHILVLYLSRQLGLLNNSASQIYSHFYFYKFA